MNDFLMSCDIGYVHHFRTTAFLIFLSNQMWFYDFFKKENARKQKLFQNIWKLRADTICWSPKTQQRNFTVPD